MVSRAWDLSISMPLSSAASIYQSAKQLRQKPPWPHEVDILDIGAMLQMVDQTAKGRGFQFDTGFVIHVPYPLNFGFEIGCNL